MRIDTFLERSAQRTPGKVALVCGERRVTYHLLNREAEALARALRASGIRRGDRVAIFLDNGPEAVLGIFGALKADGVFMVVNSTTKVEKLADLLNDARASAVITDMRRWPTVAEAAERVPSMRTIFVSGTEQPALRHGQIEARSLTAALNEHAQGPNLRREAIDLDLAALIYTSGSTGKPKGVMLTHLNMVAAATSITTYLENRPSDVILNVLPLSFDYGLYQVLMSVQVGATLVLERSFTYIHPILEAIARERITGFPIVPTIAALLLQLDLSKYDFSSLRYLTSTGATFPAAHIMAIRRQLPGVQIFSMYGLTECKRVSYLPPDDIDLRITSVGRGMPNQELYLIDADGRRLPHGIGELVVRGSHVMKGYWEQPAETERVLRPGPFADECVLHTGDLFRMDEDGYLYFLGRRDDIIKSRGEKVSPREIEEVLHRLRGISEAAVTGVPDPVLGEAIKAAVVTLPGVLLTEQDVLAHCGRYLEDFMIPQIVQFCAELPRTAHGKRDLSALRLGAESSATLGTAAV